MPHIWSSKEFFWRKNEKNPIGNLEENYFKYLNLGSHFEKNQSLQFQIPTTQIAMSGETELASL